MIYQGTVTNVGDPLKAGRVKADIPDLFMDADAGDVMESPWLEALTGLGGSAGTINVPQLGADIAVLRRFHSEAGLYLLYYLPGRWGRLEGEESSALPEARGAEGVTTSPLKEGAAFDVPSTAAGVSYEGSNPVISMPLATVPGVPGSFNAAEYPHNHTFTTPGGITVELDDTPNATRIHVWHPSGAYYEISDAGVAVHQQTTDWNRTLGNRVAHIGADDVAAVEGSHRRKVAGDKLEIVGGKTMTSASGIVLDSAGDAVLAARGTLTLKGTSALNVRSVNDMRVVSGGDIGLSALSGTLQVLAGQAAVMGGLPTKFSLITNPLPPVPLAKSDGVAAVLAALATMLSAASVAADALSGAALGDPITSPLSAPVLAWKAALDAGIAALAAAAPLVPATSVEGN